MTIPNWWGVIYLALAAFRSTRLIGWDEITEPLRELVVRKKQHTSGRYRHGLDKWLHCPWCAGAWNAIAWWGAWQLWPHATLVLAAPFAISVIVGLIGKHLDA